MVGSGADFVGPRACSVNLLTHDTPNWFIHGLISSLSAMTGAMGTVCPNRTTIRNNQRWSWSDIFISCYETLKLTYFSLSWLSLALCQQRKGVGEGDTASLLTVGGGNLGLPLCWHGWERDFLSLLGSWSYSSSRGPHWHHIGSALITVSESW